MAEPPLLATPLEDFGLRKMALEEGGGRNNVAAGKLLPRAVPGLILVESPTPSAIRRRA